VGEKQNQPFQLCFKASLKVDFRGSRITSDGGLILVGEFHERLGLGELIALHSTDSRGKTHNRLWLIRCGSPFRGDWQDTRTSTTPGESPRTPPSGSSVGRRSGNVARASRLQSFETELLTQEDKPAGLSAVNRELIAKLEAIDSPQRVVPDMDSTGVPVSGQQEHSAYNGRFESTCYDLLLLFNRQGDGLAVKLRPGNVQSAEDWEELLLPETGREQNQGREVVFRADAAFGKPEI